MFYVTFEWEQHDHLVLLLLLWQNCRTNHTQANKQKSFFYERVSETAIVAIMVTPPVVRVQSRKSWLLGAPSSSKNRLLLGSKPKCQRNASREFPMARNETRLGKNVQRPAPPFINRPMHIPKAFSIFSMSIRLPLARLCHLSSHSLRSSVRSKNTA